MGARQDMERMRLEYERTGNAVWVWGAVERAGADVELPDWVRAYLADRSKDVCLLARRGASPEEASQHIGRALGLTGAAIADHQAEQRDSWGYLALRLKRASGAQAKTAVADIAGEASVSTGTVYNWRKRTRDRIRSMKRIISK